MNSLSTPTIVDFAIQFNPNLDASPGGSDLAILGNGFFVVRDPETNDIYATQGRHFSLDENGYLVTGTGARLQGRINGFLSMLGDLQISAGDLPPTSGSPPALLCYSIDAWGKITMHLTDGTSFLRGQVMLQNFEDPQALIKEGNDLYFNMAAAGPLPALAPPGSHGLGTIQSEVLEFSRAESTNWRN